MSMLRGAGARLTAGGALALLALLALSGCSATPAPPPQTTSAAPTSAPIFANDAEALAAAKKAYGAFQQMSNLILVEGGHDPGRIKKFASSSLAESEMAGFNKARSKGWHSTGGTVFDNMQLQAVDLRAVNGVAVVKTYLCSDVSGTDVLDSTGKSLVSPSRPLRLPFFVTFDLKPHDSGNLLVGSKELWSGGGIC